MTVLKKAIIRAYTAATHKASLQVAGSLAVWLDSVPVATNIPAADVAAGRACSLLLFDAYGPLDAVVISIQGANPSTLATTAYQTIQDESVSLTQRSVLDFRGRLVRAVDDAGPAVTAVHVGKQPDGTDLFSLNDVSPHLELGVAGKVVAIRDTLRFPTAAVAHIQGPDNLERLRFNTALPEVALTGSLDVSDRLAVGPNQTPSTALRAVIGTNEAIAAAFDLLRFNLIGSSIGADNLAIALLRVLGGVTNTGRLTLALRGLYFQPTIVGGTVSILEAIRAQPGISTDAVISTIGRHFYAARGSAWSPGPGSVEWLGLDIDDLGHANLGTVTAIRVANQTASPTARLMRLLGLTADNLRADAGDPPNAALATEGDSAVLMAFNSNGTVTLRRVRYKEFGLLAALDKVLIAA